MKNQILVNKVMCPDGTILQSHHVHDYKTYTDKLGRMSMVDGGEQYLRRSGKFFELSVYANDPFIIIRREVIRVNSGKDGLSAPTITPLMHMSDEWLKATIKWCEDYQPNNIYLLVYKLEKEYRIKHKIEIKE
jgi:hypothetical protein